MAKIGYARVSPFEQDSATQEIRLKAVGCEVVRSEKVSGKSRAGRDELAASSNLSGPVMSLLS